MPLYENWMDKCKGLGGAKLRHASQFYTNLPIHVLPGDESLVIPFLATLTAHIRRVGGNIESIRFLEPATILFHLVIIRVYLGRSPTDDDQIFTLAQEGRIIRQLTVPEQAMAAGESSEDTRYPPLPHCEVCVIGIKLDPHLTIPADFPLATAHTSNQQAYIWSASDKQGLSGGPSYNTYLRPQLWVVDPSIPWPKPKPTYGKRKIVVAKTTEEAPKHHSAEQGILEGQGGMSPPSEGNSAVGTKRQRGKSGEREELVEPAVRRSKRHQRSQ